tara:strand:+ start:278 stop:496 length:219 start_codon:yes stop_codon:yes gene_type:complete
MDKINFTNEQWDAIFDAYEELLLIMKEQYEEAEEYDFPLALEEVRTIHNLISEMEKEVVSLYSNDESPFYTA